ncbi:MAG: class I SAM-dependent methyltransferase [Rhodobacteraceae bacterium]|nr:class I SAM-dependent methyltransferase [Paracoccaceae bacterium]
MSEREFLTEEQSLTRCLGDLSGLKAADIGCGSGRFTRLLARMGAEAVGVEPNPKAVAKAEAEGGALRYIVATAEATGLEGHSMDLTLFSFSLHHCPDMPAALREACRITRPGGRIAVIEPQADDPMFPVLKLVDDEGPVYTEAIATMADAVLSGLLRRQGTLDFADKYRVDTPEETLARLITVDNGRSLPDADRPAFDAAFAAARVEDEIGGYLPCWVRMDVFERA